MSKYTLAEKSTIIKNYCLNETKSINPIEIAISLMHHESVDIHGPEHHVLDGAAFLCAMHNAGVEFDLDRALDQIIQRGGKMPGAMCGLWGVCGSASSLGAALSIINKTTYLSERVGQQILITVQEHLIEFLVCQGLDVVREMLIIVY